MSQREEQETSSSLNFLGKKENGTRHDHKRESKRSLRVTRTNKNLITPSPSHTFRWRKIGAYYPTVSTDFYIDEHQEVEPRS